MEIPSGSSVNPLQDCLTLDEVISRIAVCDVVLYLRTRNGVIEYPSKYRGKNINDILKKVNGIIIRACDGNYEHYFIIKPTYTIKLTEKQTNN